ncbi:MAG: glutamyl-tRNA reductase [Sphingobacteriales bacterium]|nr:glutamyl-tRNA reductase [Sphingobacteriales bacterium]
MEGNGPTAIHHFFVCGINYKKSDAAARGQFAVSNDQYALLLEQAPSFGISELFIVSTCNRTEIYGFADQAGRLSALLCSKTEGSLETFSNLCYTHKGLAAVEHLFEVGAGLDSQILGDYEIVGQIKQAARIAKEHGRINAFTERLLNCMLQSSKAIKNHTALSNGTISVSFAAVQYIKESVSNIAGKKILLLGTGKIGHSTCKNLVDYLGTRNITLINRTDFKACQLAEELGLRAAPATRLQEEIDAAAIILVATNAEQPVIGPAHLLPHRQKLLIDLSIPNNVDPAVAALDGITLVNVDELSKLKDETLARRQAEVPKARAIIAEYLAEFNEWYQMRKHVPVLKAVKTKLKEIHSSPLFVLLYDSSAPKPDADAKIQRVINGMANKLKVQNQKGCHYIEAINEFIATGINA